MPPEQVMTVVHMSTVRMQQMHVSQLLQGLKEISLGGGSVAGEIPFV